MPIGLAPEVTYFRPSRKIASARTVAVVVPSPASSLVLLATSRTICAPMFSHASSSSISLATVTPSLVTVGDPNFLSSTTLRPLGPSVALTARLNFSTPLRRDWRASSSKINCFAGINQMIVDGFNSCELFDDGENVITVEDLVFLAVQFDFSAAIFADQHTVTLLDFEGNLPAIVVGLTSAERHDHAFHRFSLWRYRG